MERLPSSQSSGHESANGVARRSVEKERVAVVAMLGALMLGLV